MQTKKIMLVLLAGLLLAGLGLVTNPEPVTANSAAQTEEQITEEQTEEAETPMVEEAQTLMEALQAREELESFKLLVEAAALTDNLEQDGPFTVFAPTNSAMAVLDRLLEGSEVTATEALLYHVVNGRYTAADLANRLSVPTLMGEHITISVRDGALVLNGEVAIIRIDIEVENGIIHIVDTVMVPSDQAQITPEEERGVRVNALDDVLAADGRFTTFLSLLETAGLLDELANPVHTYTVFAPTDASFDQWPEELYDRLLTDSDYLETILTYHLVSDRLAIHQIATDTYIPTVEQRPLIVSRDNEGRVLINERPFVSANIMAANGIIHVVDGVLTP
jgi:transforming growth factor-beta-induced protein